MGSAWAGKIFGYGERSHFWLRSGRDLPKPRLNMAPMKSSSRMIPALADYRAEPYASTLSALASAQSPDLILFPTTARTRELAAMCAVDLNTGVLTDISGLEANGRSTGRNPSDL